MLENLAEAGLLEARGERKARAHHLSARTYGRLGEGTAYVRQRGFGPLQQEQMVLQVVEAYGRATRSQAAELCPINPGQAYRLLKRLVGQGSLTRHGTGKGAWYGRSA